MPELRIPERVHRRDITAKVRKRRLCLDDRPYAPVIWTIPASVLAVADFGPMWRADRDYYIARVAATIGLHVDADHPADGTPGGQAVKTNIRHVTADLATDSAVMSSDSILDIDPNSHKDAADVTQGEFNILTLDEGEYLYPRVTQIGTTRPGGVLQVTVTLVPVR